MPAVDPVVAGGSQTMKSKLGVSRQAALKRVASSDKELTEDYEKQERCVTANVAAAGRLLGRRELLESLVAVVPLAGRRRRGLGLEERLHRHKYP